MIVFDFHIFHQLLKPDTSIERPGFLVGYRDGDNWVVTDLWPTGNAWRGDRRNNYRISPPAFGSARRKAAKMQVSILGHAHTHVVASHKPSLQDYAYIRSGELGAVYDLSRGSIVWYDKHGTLQTDPCPKPNKYRSLFQLAIRRLWNWPGIVLKNCSGHHNHLN